VLSNEDSLRLHVLLKNVEAIRIDEEALVVYGLTMRSGVPTEAKVALNPTCRPEQYLRRVREFLSGTVLGSPGGYPLHLNRWTRMGQAKDTNLAALLMLGEVEAVAAVSGAPGLTDDLAQRVWWAAPTAESARRMLERPSVVNGRMGSILAQHLIEHLPFEGDPRVIMDTVRLALTPGLINDDDKQRLWLKGERQNAYRVGFLQALPRHLPQPLTARPDLLQHGIALGALADKGNALARTLLLTLDAAGQTFVHTCRLVMERPTHPEVTAAALNVIGAYFRPGSVTPAERDIRAIVAYADVAHREAQQPNERSQLGSILRATPDLAPDLRALLVLAGVSERVVVDILAHTSASGTVLQKKLQPVTSIIIEQLHVLRRST
jgi:hypothetical protein